jgi:hypothetical protein
MRTLAGLEALAEQLDTLPELAWRAVLSDDDVAEPAEWGAEDELVLLARLRAGPDEPRGSPP